MGPYFLQNKDGATITVIGGIYRIMIIDFFFVAALHGIDMYDFWFQ